ncbi:MAG: VWA domain-containing protein [Hyphomicrobiaceae bacterium]|nr:VWA domain-containing protein [Hyphomicrobiaceae bacterium]
MHTLKKISDKSGSIPMLLGLLLPILVMFVGLAIDYTRVIRDREHAQKVLDASLLAGAVAYQGGATFIKAENTAEDYLNANKASSRPYKASFKFDKDRLSGNLKSSTATPVMSVAGFREIEWDVTGEVGYSLPPAIDYALALDISSSMEARGHMPALRSALQEFSQAAFEGVKTDDVSATLVPFANGVSFPERYSRWVNPAKGFIYTRDFVGCFFPEAIGVKATLKSNLPGSYRAAPDLVQVAQNNIFCPRPGTQISFYADNASDLDARIKSLESFQGTATADGLSWAWRTLEPSWSSKFQESSQCPRPHAKENKKVIVLLTDGLPYYRPWNEKKLTDARKDALRRDALREFEAVCEAIAADGRFDLYMIGYGDAMTPEETTALQGCTAGDGSFVRADKANLAQVFKGIARKTVAIALRR